MCKIIFHTYHVRPAAFCLNSQLTDSRTMAFSFILSNLPYRHALRLAFAFNFIASELMLSTASTLAYTTRYHECFPHISLNIPFLILRLIFSNTFLYITFRHWVISKRFRVFCILITSYPPSCSCSPQQLPLFYSNIIADLSTSKIAEVIILRYGRKLQLS